MSVDENATQGEHVGTVVALDKDTSDNEPTSYTITGMLRSKEKTATRLLPFPLILYLYYREKTLKSKYHSRVQKHATF